MHGLQGKLLIFILLPAAQMNFGEVTSTQAPPDGKLILQVEHDDMVLERLHPLLSHFDLLNVELDGLALRHHHDAEQVALVRVLEPVPLDSAVAYVQDPGGSLIAIACIPSEGVLHQHVEVIVEAGLRARLRHLVIVLVLRLVLRDCNVRVFVLVLLETVLRKLKKTLEIIYGLDLDRI